MCRSRSNQICLICGFWKVRLPLSWFLIERLQKSTIRDLEQDSDWGWHQIYSNEIWQSQPCSLGNTRPNQPQVLQANGCRTENTFLLKHSCIRCHSSTLLQFFSNSLLISSGFKFPFLSDQAGPVSRGVTHPIVNNAPNAEYFVLTVYSLFILKKLKKK